jgi:hypothetical protein
VTARTLPPMVATVTRPGPSVLVVTVEHDPRQSYSRAVAPAATRKARTCGLALTLVAVDYDAPAPAGRAGTAYRYEVAR